MDEETKDDKINTFNFSLIGEPIDIASNFDVNVDEILVEPKTHLEDEGVLWDLKEDVKAATMKLPTRIFRRTDWYITSPFGWRTDPISGATRFHAGTDYGTYGQKWPQYALENGTVMQAGKLSDGALICWIEYPRLGIKCLHAHLDSLNVKSGQAVNSNTILGNTGMTGYATGVHLHLQLRYLNNPNTDVDPESYIYTEAEVTPPSIYPFNTIIKKGTLLFNQNGVQYANPASVDREVTVLGEVNGMYKISGKTFNPNIVYVHKNAINNGNKFPFNGTIRKDSILYREDGSRYPNPAFVDRSVTVLGEHNGMYKINGKTFNPNIVYCQKSAILHGQ